MDRLRDYTDGVDATLYANLQTGKYILAYKGTTPTSLDDLDADAQAFFTVSQRVQESIKLAIALKKEFKQNLSFMGIRLEEGWRRWRPSRRV